MVARAEVTVEWANGVHLFALNGKQIEVLESECHNPETGKKGIGIGAIWLRLMSNTFYYSDIKNVIRLGLIGGGMGAVEAMRLVNNYVEGVPISSLEQDMSNPNCPLTLARVIMSSAFVGIEPGKSMGEKETPEN